jgi:tyrosine-protein kinase Etk/Wzc
VHAVAIDAGAGLHAAHDLDVRPRQYPTRRLTVDESFVNPPAPVLARIEPVEVNPERTRRRADRQVPPLIELTSDRYVQLYHRLADVVARLPRMAVVGDDAAVVATVAANLAAAAAHAARSAVLVDTDFDLRSVAGVLHVRATPGLADVLAGRVDWPAAVVTALVGRDRTINVLPAGAVRGAAPLAAAADALRREVDRLTRRYDTVIVSAPAARRGSVGAAAAAAGEAVICARVARTPVRTLRRLITEVRDAGATVRGVVLWDTDDPVLRAPEEGDDAARRGEAVATSEFATP